MRGVLLFAVNNSLVDYVRLATLNAKFIKKHMGVSVCLVTDSVGAAQLEEGIFDHVVIDEHNEAPNARVYRDTESDMVKADFKNFSRPSAYDLSPYDETLMIDVDYLIQSDILNCVWGSPEELMINNSAMSLLNQPLSGDEYRLNPFGIRMYWATAVYFKKTPFVQNVFEMVKHIRSFWDYYKLMYGFPGSMYRNDYAFSIALHTMGGFQEDTGIKPLPVPYILTATDKDQLHEVVNGSLLLFANDPKDRQKFYLTKVSNQNLHCMNKVSLIRHIEALEQLV